MLEGLIAVSAFVLFPAVFLVFLSWISNGIQGQGWSITKAYRDINDPPNGDD